MLSAPGFCLHRARPPFLQLVVGPAHPAVERVVGYTSFLLWFSCVLVLYFLFFLFYYFYLYCGCPCLPWVPRVGFLCMGDA